MLCGADACSAALLGPRCLLMSKDLGNPAPCCYRAVILVDSLPPQRILSSQPLCIYRSTGLFCAHPGTKVGAKPAGFPATRPRFSAVALGWHPVTVPHCGMDREREQVLERAGFGSRRDAVWCPSTAPLESAMLSLGAVPVGSGSSQIKRSR